MWLRMAAAPLQEAWGLRVLIAGVGKRRAKRQGWPLQGSQPVSPELGAERGEDALGRCMLHEGMDPPGPPPRSPSWEKKCSPALISLETETSLEVSADLGCLLVLNKLAAQPPATGPLGKFPKRSSDSHSQLF